VGHGFVVPQVPSSFGGIFVVMALIGTTITPYMQLYLQSSVAEKGIRAEDYVYEQADVVGGSLFGNIVSASIIIAAAAALFVHGGTDVSTAADAAKALKPVAGPLAEALFAVGLLGACLLAAPVLALTSAYSVAEALGLEKGVSENFSDAPVFMGVFTGMIVLGAGLALLPGIPFTNALLIIQIVNGLVLPVVLVSLLQLTNDRELMGARVNTLAFNIIGVVTVAVVVALSVILVAFTIGRPFFG
jgi:Mn2+/Fe2+ NRAMP family transporter